MYIVLKSTNESALQPQRAADRALEVSENDAICSSDKSLSSNVWCKMQ